MTQSHAQQADLGNEKISRLLFKMAVPSITAQLINALYNIVDRIYIGHIPEVGATALTGVGVSFPIIMILSAFSSLVGMGGAPKAAIAMGRGDKEEAEKILGNCCFTLIFLSVLLTVTLSIFQEKLLFLFGASDATIGYALQYMNIYLLGTIFVQIVLGLNPFINSQGFAKIGMLTTLIGAVLNCVLDPIFIFTFGLGVRGAAIATVLSQAVSALWVFAFFFGKKTVLKLKKKYFRFQPAIILPVLALGVSPFVMQSTESLLTVCFNTSLQKYGGDIAVGAMTILTSIMQFTMLPLTGLTQGAQPIVSYNFGAKQYDRVKKAFQLLLTCSFLFTLIMWAINMFLPQIFIRLFSNQPELIQMTIWACRIYMAVLALMGIQIACQQTFIALSEAGVSIFLAVLRKIILLIPLIYILPAVIPDSFAQMFLPEAISSALAAPEKVFSVFLAEPVADAIAITVTSILFTLRFKKILKQGQKEALS